MRYYDNPDRNCANGDTEAWFPDKKNQRATHEAKRLCRGCPVVAECLEDVLRFEKGLGKVSRAGIYGGTTPAERFAMETKANGGKRPLRPINHGTDAGYKQHQRRSETACRDCLDAHREADRVREAKKETAA